MNKIIIIAFAGALGLLGLACGWSAPASAQVDPGVKVSVGGTAGVTDGTIADRTRENWVGQTYGTLLGRDVGAGVGTTGELVPAVMPTDQMPADQREVNSRADFVGGVYGDVLGRDNKGGSLGSLASVGSVDNLFPLSRGENGTPPSHSTDHVKVFNGNNATGGPHVNPGAAKGPTVANQGGNAGSTKGITVVKTTR